MRQVKSKEPIANRDAKIGMWQERSPVERRTDQDKRNPNRDKYFFHCRIKPPLLGVVIAFFLIHYPHMFRSDYKKKNTWRRTCASC